MAYNIHLGLHPQPKRVLAQFIQKQTRMRVAQGPFAGMEVVDATFGSALLPKLAGTYELELQSDIEDLLRNDYRRFIDVGAAEGYYAIGMATRLREKNIEVVAYDINAESSVAVRAAAEKNGIARNIDMRRLCSHQDLQAVERGRTLIICDIEGEEKELLDPRAAPGLASCDIVVEVHDGPGKQDIRGTLIDRFSSSHHISSRKHCMRRHRDLGRLRWMLTQDLGQLAMHEGRTFGIEWLVLRTKASR